MANAAWQARCAWSSWAMGAPKRAITPSPRNWLTVPSYLWTSSHEEAETPVHDLVNRLRIELLEHSGGVRHIREHNGNDFVFTLD